MLTRRTVGRLGLALLSGLPLAGCGYPTYRIRYRSKLVVNDHGVVRSGIGVVEFQVHDHSKSFLGNSGLVSQSRGAAAFVALQSGGVAAVSLDSFRGRNQVGSRPMAPDSYDPSSVFENAPQGDDVWRDGRNEAYERLIRNAPAHPVTVSRTIAPPLLFFRDRLDPTSVVSIDLSRPEAEIDDGVLFQSLTLQITTDEPSFDPIYQTMPWLRGLAAAGVMLDGSQIRYTNNLSNLIGAEALVRENFL